MNEKICIIPYESKFQDEVVDLIVHIQQKEYNVPITKEEQPDLLEIETFYQRDSGNFWVATYDGKVVGTVALLDIGKASSSAKKNVREERVPRKRMGRITYATSNGNFLGERKELGRHLFRNNS